MTYCLGMLLDAGLVVAADSRTNAGMDNVSKFRKIHVFERPGERMIVLLTAGNLAVTQAVVSLLAEGHGGPEGVKTLYEVGSLHEAAGMVGRALRRVHDIDGPYLKAQDTDFVASFILGGQIKGEWMRLFQIYAAGNFIEATTDTPFFQIGETKYGKPIMDRVVRPSLDLVSALKCALVSIDSTIRSNVSVAPPIDLLVYRRDDYKVSAWQRFEDDDPYFNSIRSRWGEGLRHLFETLPAPEWAEKLAPPQVK